MIIFRSKTNQTTKDTEGPEGFVIFTQKKHGWMSP